MGLIDWAADKVQTISGEKERRFLVEELKANYEDFKGKITEQVFTLNQLVSQFNEKVKKLNKIRNGRVKGNIFKLHSFLGKFGSLKEIGGYIDESRKDVISLPEQQFEKIETYIGDIDWSKDEVFQKTFFSIPIVAKRKSRNHNLSLREHLNEFKLEANHTMSMLRNRGFSLKLDREICDLYIECIEFISMYIDKYIIKELELVEALLQSIKIKDRIIADEELEGVVFFNDVYLLKDTLYENHYIFIKNTFMFYIISCKIYNTPILTKLLNSQTSNNDYKLLEKQKKALFLQGENIEKNIVLNK